MLRLSSSIALGIGSGNACSPAISDRSDCSTFSGDSPRCSPRPVRESISLIAPPPGPVSSTIGPAAMYSKSLLDSTPALGSGPLDGDERTGGSLELDRPLVGDDAEEFEPIERTQLLGVPLPEIARRARDGQRDVDAFLAELDQRAQDRAGALITRIDPPGEHEPDGLAQPLVLWLGALGIEFVVPVIDHLDGRGRAGH